MKFRLFEICFFISILFGSQLSYADTSSLNHEEKILIRTSSKVFTFQNIRFKKISTTIGNSKLSSIELLGRNNKFKIINTKLRELLWLNSVEAKECILENGEQGSYKSWVIPKFVGNNFMTLMMARETYCGSMTYINSVPILQTWSLFSGETIDLLGWFTNSTENTRISEQLKIKILSKSERLSDRECNEEIRETTYYNMGLSENGIIFTPLLSHAEQACADDITVPYAELKPYLSTLGSTAISNL